MIRFPKMKPNPAGSGISIARWERIRHLYPRVKGKGSEVPDRKIKTGALGKVPYQPT
jgi:hypothetical protein